MILQITEDFIEGGLGTVFEIVDGKLQLRPGVLSGTWGSEPHDISADDTGGYSRITYQKVQPAGTTAYMRSRLFVNGAWGDWKPDAYQPGDPISDFPGTSLVGAKLQTKLYLSRPDAGYASPSFYQVQVYAEDALKPFREEYGHSCVLLYMDLLGGGGYYSTLDVDTYWENHTYIPLAFRVSEFTTSTGFNVDSMTVQFDNASLIPAAIFLNEDQRNRQVIVHFAGTDKFGRIRQAKEIITGYISSIRILSQTVEVQINQELAFWNRVTLRKHDYDTFRNMQQIELREFAWGRELNK